MPRSHWTTYLLPLLLVLPLQLSAAMPADLVRVGSGEVRYLGMIKVYDAALYAPAGATRNQIQQAGTSFCLELNYQVDLSADKFVLAAEKVLQRQHSAAALAPYRDRFDQLHASYLPVSQGDQYRLCYQAAAQSTRLSLNGRELVALRGADFATLYSGIWLSPDQPIDSKLQRHLLQALPIKEQP